MGPLTITAIAAGIGSLWSAISGNRRRRAAERKINNQIQELTDWRNQELSSNYLNRADSQAVLREVRENNEEMLDALNGTAAKRGLSDEAKVATANDMAKNTARAVSQISAVGQQHKDNVQQQYMNNVAQLRGQQIAALYDTTGSDNMVSNLMNAAGNIAQLYALGGNAGAGGNNTLTALNHTPVAMKGSLSELKPVATPNTLELAQIRNPKITI